MAFYESSLKQEKDVSTLPSEEYTLKVMPATLSTFDMTAIYIAALFFIGNVTNLAAGGVAALTYLLLGGVLFFFPCVIVSAQLGVIFPHEGALYNWTNKILGRYWGFFASILYWLPGMLAIIGAANGFVVYVQGMNHFWLAEPWQQGLAILAIIILGAYLGMQHLRTTQYIVNGVVILLLGAVIFIGLAGLLSFIHNGAKAPLGDPAAWSLGGQNFGLCGFVALLYLRTSVPMNMSGEISGRKVITQHLFLGTLLVVPGYIISALSLLVVRGAALSRVTNLPYELIVVVDVALGRFIGTIVAVCILSFYLIMSLVHNSTSARLLFVASVDRRLPAFTGQVNKHRAPANAVFVQTIVASVLVILLFFIVPYILPMSRAADIASEVYPIIFATIALIGIFVAMFYFANLLFLYRRNSVELQRWRIFPMWLLWTSMIAGPISGLIAIISILSHSWTPLIANDQWWFIISGIALISIIFAATGSIVVTGAAVLEDLHQ